MSDLAVYGLAPVSEMAPALACAARGIPVGGRDGIRGYAIVDAEDYEWAMARRWHFSKDGYVVTNVPRGDGRRTTLRLSRAIMELAIGDPTQVDHIDLDPLNNRRSNLRLATNAQNCQNRRPRGGSSRYRGVTFHKECRKWLAQAKLNGKLHYLGLYETEQEAADVAAAWREEHMPFTTN